MLFAVCCRICMHVYASRMSDERSNHACFVTHFTCFVTQFSSLETSTPLQCLLAFAASSSFKQSLCDILRLRRTRNRSRPRIPCLLSAGMALKDRRLPDTHTPLPSAASPLTSNTGGMEMYVELCETQICLSVQDTSTGISVDSNVSCL